MANLLFLYCKYRVLNREQRQRARSIFLDEHKIAVHLVIFVTNL